LILGSFAARLGRIAEAERLLRRAALADPFCYDAVRWLTTLLIGRNGGQEAIDFGQEAVRLKPDEAESHVILGLAAIGGGDSTLAISSFQRAVKLNPQMAGAYHNLGIAFEREASIDEAIEAFKRAIELSPNVAETHLHLGRSFLLKNQGDEALACAERVLEINPNLRNGKRLKADASFIAVLGDNGEEHIRRAIQSSPNSGFPYALLGSRLQEQGNFSEADESISRSIELEPNQGLAYYLFAHNRKIRDEDRPLLTTMERICEQEDILNLERRYIHFALGKAYDDLGSYDRAIHHLDLANGESDTNDHDEIAFDSARHASRVHRFIDLFSSEFLERFQGAGIGDDDPIFIFGMPRSGTTLLEQIISRHSKVGAAGEQSFWRDSGRRIVSLNKGLLDADELRKASHRYIELLHSIAPGMAHVTDKFPGNYIYLGMLHLAFPNAHFIHARRNPVDTCLSIYMRPFFTVQEMGRSRQRIVETYRLYLESMKHWRSILPSGRFLEVDYEQLVTNTEETTRRVINHCGLNWEDACLRPQEGNRRVLTFSKWQVRQPVYTTSVERWRNYEPWLGVFRQLMELP
jgi:tetratricopeptide (TPR) repeat protein